MKIVVENLGKKFNYEWIFRNLNYTFSSDRSYAIVGPNGSGKSTLAKVITSFIPFTSGKISYFLDNDRLLHLEETYPLINFAAPYVELIEEFTLSEFLTFHFNFRKVEEISVTELLQRLRLSGAVNKPIKFFSSGMKQRLKLGLAFYTVAQVIILDEPTSNLDEQGIQFYQEEVVKQLDKKLVVVCSNQKHEYSFCDEIIDVTKNKS